MCVQWNIIILGHTLYIHLYTSVLIKPLMSLYNKSYICICIIMIIFLVDLLLDEISECFGKDAVLLTLTPKTIGGKNVKGLFAEYVPRKSRFVEVFLVRDLALRYRYTMAGTCN